MGDRERTGHPVSQLDLPTAARDVQRSAADGDVVEPSGPTVFDASDMLNEAGDGVHWTLARPGDLNANLVQLNPGHHIGDHVNHEVDVVIIAVAGSGTIEIEGISSPLRPNVVADVPKGTSRRIEAGPDGLGYFTIHRRRTFDVMPRPTTGDEEP